MFRGSLIHDLPNRDAARKKDHVELLCEDRRSLRNATLNDRQKSGIEVFPQKLRDKTAAVDGQLTRFEHNGAPGGDCRDDGAKRQLIGIVPGPDDQTHAKGLRDDVALRRRVERIRGYEYLLRPFVEFLQGDSDLVVHHTQLSYKSIEPPFAVVRD